MISKIVAKYNRLKIADCRISPDIEFFLYPFKFSRVNIHPRKNLEKQSIVLLILIQYRRASHHLFEDLSKTHFNLGRF